MEYVSREEAQTWSNQITHLLDQFEEALTEAPTIEEAATSPAVEELLDNRLRRLVNHLWTGNVSLDKNVRDALILVGAAINDVLNNDDEGTQMKIKTVNASIRKTVETTGQWRGVELGAEAEIEPNEDWRSAQAALTKQLQEQMKAIFLPFHQGEQEAPADTDIRLPTATGP